MIEREQLEARLRTSVGKGTSVSCGESCYSTSSVEGGRNKAAAGTTPHLSES
jgi:hypothetical protein